MKRSSSHLRSSDRKAKKANFLDQIPTNDKRNRKIEFEAFSKRLSVKILPEKTSTTHQLAGLTKNHVPNDAEKVVIPTVCCNKEFEEPSKRFSVKILPEKISTSHQMASSTKNHVPNDAEKVVIPAIRCKKEFEEPSKRICAENLPEKISTFHQTACLTDYDVPKDAEEFVIPAVWPPSIMMRKSLNFEAHLKLIDKKFGGIRKKKAGIFIKLMPDNNDRHRELTSFLIANNIKYLTPKRIKVVIAGLPCDMRTQRIKEALTERCLYVKEVVQLTEFQTKKPLPLFQVVLPSSNRNKNILYMTDLLNFSISVGRIERCTMRRCNIECSVKNTHNNGTATSDAGVSKGEPVLVAKFRKASNNSSIKLETTDRELPRMTNMAESEPSTDFHDNIYIMQEFRKLLGKINNVKIFAQQLRNAKNSVEKCNLFSRVFLE